MCQPWAGLPPPRHASSTPVERRTPGQQPSACGHDEESQEDRVRTCVVCMLLLSACYLHGEADHLPKAAAGLANYTQIFKRKKKSPHNIYRKTLLEKKKKISAGMGRGGEIKKYIYFSIPKETLFSESKFTGGGQVHWPEVEVGDGRQGGSHAHVTSGSPIGQSPLLRQRRSGKQRGSRSDPHQCLPAASVCLGVPYGRHVT